MSADRNGVLGDHKDRSAMVVELVEVAKLAKEYVKHPGGEHLPPKAWFTLNERLSAVLARADASMEVSEHANALAALHLGREALRTLAGSAGDVDEFNKGGVAYEACRAMDAVLAGAPLPAPRVGISMDGGIIHQVFSVVPIDVTVINYDVEGIEDGVLQVGDQEATVNRGPADIVDPSEFAGIDRAVEAAEAEVDAEDESEPEGMSP